MFIAISWSYSFEFYCRNRSFIKRKYIPRWWDHIIILSHLPEQSINVSAHDISIFYIIHTLYIKPLGLWQWLMVRLPGGINQLMIEGLPAASYGNQSGMVLDDVTIKRCEHFSKSQDIVSDTFQTYIGWNMPVMHHCAKFAKSSSPHNMWVLSFRNPSCSAPDTPMAESVKFGFEGRIIIDRNENTASASADPSLMYLYFDILLIFTTSHRDLLSITVGTLGTVTYVTVPRVPTVSM